MKAAEPSGLWLLDRRRFPNEDPLQLRRWLLESRLGRGTTGYLRYDMHGKPYLPGGPDFNLSHSGDYFLLAVSSQPIGVDIERRRLLDYTALAARCFHPQEQALLRQTDPAEAQTLFFDIWTCRESCLKATGYGLTLPAHCFHIHFPTKDQAILQRADAAFPAAFSAYHIYRYHLLSGYSIALCIAPEFAKPQLQEIS